MSINTVKRVCQLSALWLVTLVLAACAGGRWLTYENDAAGITFDVPRDWVVDASADSSTSGGTLLQISGAPDAAGHQVSGTVLVASDARFTTTDAPDVLHDYFTALFTTGDGRSPGVLTPVRPTTMIDIAAQPAATSQYRLQDGRLVTYITIANAQQIAFFTLIDGTTEGAAETVERLQQSIRLTGGAP